MSDQDSFNPSDSQSDLEVDPSIATKLQNLALLIPKKKTITLSKSRTRTNYYLIF